MCVILVCFFFKQKTAYEMRISDWSSDVCSSDLIDAIKDPGSELPHMLPPPHIFSAKVRRLGLGDGLRLVIYDQRGIFSAPRVWWTFRAFGHEEVALRDGGLPKWLTERRPVSSGAARPAKSHITPTLTPTHGQ